MPAEFVSSRCLFCVSPFAAEKLEDSEGCGFVAFKVLTVSARWPSAGENSASETSELGNITGLHCALHPAMQASFRLKVHVCLNSCFGERAALDLASTIFFIPAKLPAVVDWVLKKEQPTLPLSCFFHSQKVEKGTASGIACCPFLVTDYRIPSGIAGSAQMNSFTSDLAAPGGSARRPCTTPAFKALHLKTMSPLR